MRAPGHSAIESRVDRKKTYLDGGHDVTMVRAGDGPMDPLAEDLARKYFKDLIVGRASILASLCLHLSSRSQPFLVPAPRWQSLASLRPRGTKPLRARCAATAQLAGRGPTHGCQL